MALLYPHKTFWINHREVALESLYDQSELPRDAFEASTFEFIRLWLSEANLFTLNTSGSTGAPKPIELTRTQLEASAKFTLQALNLTEKGNALVCLDTRFIAGRMMLVRSFIAGLVIHAFTPSSRIIDQLPEIPFELAAFVPMQVYGALNSANSSRLNNICHLLIGGAPLLDEARQKLTHYSCRAYLTYGMTETISHVALQLIEATGKQIYQALPGIQLKKDERGCLIIHAPHLSNPVITNDLVEWISESQFRWLGRWDNIINTGGIKVIPEVLEMKIGPILTELNVTGDYFIYGIPDSYKGEEVVLFIEGKPIPEIPITAMLRKYLSPYETPRRMVWCDTFIRTDNEKIMRRKTVDQYFTLQ